ncbi:MAG: hypothetical protein HC927_12855 [Deltaproteobacteria bacterium]|nr:hypothetical protein [Deltaproteobacteria bacterium]
MPSPQKLLAHMLVLKVHELVQPSVPPPGKPCETQVWPPRLLKSHCSLPSIIPSPQSVQAAVS